MINFEITSSPDSNVESTFMFYQNQVYIGRNSGNLWINDRELFHSHALLEVVGKDLLIHPQKGVEFYLINSKRASAIRKLKVNDQITIGQTVLKVLNFEETIFESKKSLLDSKLNKLVETNSSRLSVIENLTKLMK